MTDDEFEWAVPDRFNFARDVVDYWARDPERLALIAVNEAGEERTFTYQEISQASSELANLLARAGLSQGDRVIVMLPRIAQWQIAMVAVMRLGAVPIPCITMLTEKDVAYRVEHSGAVGAITLAEETPKYEALGSLRVKVCVGDGPNGWASFEDAVHETSTCEPADVEREDSAILYYTSGSTGAPKGVTHSARAIWAWRFSAEYWLGLTPADRIWCTADTGWSKAGTSILFGPWSQGASVLFYDGPFAPEARLALLEKYQVTCFCAAATELRRLVLEDVSQYDLSSLKSTVSAGESVNPEVIERWHELTGTTVLDGYGQTETLMTITNRPGQPVKPGSMGVPLPGLDIGVFDAETGRVAKQGEGELVLALPYPQLMLGYWEDPDRTRDTEIHVDGSEWYRTGDNVAIDSDGYVFYTGRADDIINSSGYRIGPQEVENALSEHAAVLECAVVGVPDEERGELVKAWIVLAPGFAPSDDLVRELQDHAKAITAPYKYPRQIAFADDLPKTVSGKIRRNVLRERK
jgi:acyl-coenzyme A synthetase/AMP-(fatty) acid ligase